MICVDRFLRFKNMEDFAVNYLNDFNTEGLTDDEIDDLYENHLKEVRIIFMDLNRPATPEDNKTIPWDEEYAECNYIKVIVLSNFKLDDDLMADIADFCEYMLGSLNVKFDIEFLDQKIFKKYNNYDPYASLEEEDKETYKYYKRIGEHYGVKFEPGEYTPEKMEHLSQD